MKRGALAGVLLCVALAASAQPAVDCAPADPGTPALPAPDLHGRRIAIALGSGSMHGLAHIGVLQELEAHGLRVDVVAGTSVGAIVGALWARGFRADEIASLSSGAEWEQAGEFSPSFESLFTNRSLQQQMRKLLGDKPIESWPKRFGAVATDLASGHRVLLVQGDGAVAVQASSAVPVMFAPVSVKGVELTDGALVEPVPIRAARDLGGDFVIAVDVAYRPYEEPAHGLVQFGFQAVHVLVNSLAESQAREADFRLRLDLHHAFQACGPHAMIAIGRDGMRRAWPLLVAAMQGRSAPAP